MLTHDPGLGKSRMALDIAKVFRRKRPIIVICPCSVKYSWEEEVKIHTKFQTWVLEGRRPPKRMPWYIPQVIILNWEILDAWWEFLKRLDPSVVVLDEFHYIKSRKAIRTSAAVNLCDGVPHIIGLSGTPFENHPSEIWVTLHIIKRKKFKHFLPFGRRYCKPRRTPWGIKYDGASNEAELRKLLYSECMIRRKRGAVLKELPPVTPTLVPLKINRTNYAEAEENIIAWLVSKGKSIRGALTAPGFTKFNHLLQLTAEEKKKELIKWIDEFLENTDEKLVLFGYHRDFLRPLYEHYKKVAVIVDGKVKGRQRQAAINEFVNKKVKRLFFGNIIAAGTGINKLQRACHHVAIGEFIFNPQKIKQAIARVDRMGQRNPVSLYFLFASGTVEEKVAKTLIKKQAMFDTILDGGKSDGEFNMLVDVARSLRKRKPAKRRKLAA